MLVMARKPGEAACPYCFEANFSVKEKDEASPVRECAPGFDECLHSPICRGLKAFAFQAPALVSQPLTRSAIAAGQLKDP
jgi:hypothetical protein